MTALATHPVDDPGQLTLIADRFVDRFEIRGQCWVWTGVVSNGYGRIGIGRTYLYAHRASHELFIGPIPAGMHVDHLCCTPLCVNPEHLEAVTPAENNRRSYAVNARVAARRSNPCIRGHERTLENVRVDPKTGKIHCRPCQREAWHQRKGVAT